MSASSSDEVFEERFDEVFEEIFEDTFTNIVEAQTSNQRIRAYIERNR